MKICPACGMVFPDESAFCFLSGDTLQPTEDALIGTTIDGHFRIDQLLADGPRAKLYAAHHRLLASPCIVKVIKDDLDEVKRALFNDALAKSLRCTHTNVTPLIGGGITAEGVAFVVNAKRDATTLAAKLIAGQMRPAEALGVGAQLLLAVARIHDFGGVHGSLRPSNVLLSAAGHAEVVDVGLGRSLLRDPWEDDPSSLEAQQYLAPELSSSQRSGMPADLYSVGVTVFQMLNGRVPFQVSTLAELRSKVNEEGVDVDGPLGALHEALRKWLSRLVARMPASRPANAHQALGELSEACEAAGLTPAPDPGPAADGDNLELGDGFARWVRFQGLFSRMLEIGFPSGAPDHTRESLAAIAGRVEQLTELGTKALFEHGNMVDVLGRARQGREGIADQMNVLNDAGKDVRRELHPLQIAAERHGEKAAAFPEQAIECHAEVVRWEGRSGFYEPYKELVDAYRVIADVMEKWWSVRSAQLACEKDAAEKNEALKLLDDQLDELRQALSVHESNLASEIDACATAIRQLGVNADKLELELLDLASRFSAPLRSKPELGACFRELIEV